MTLSILGRRLLLQRSKLLITSSNHNSNTTMKLPSSIYINSTNNFLLKRYFAMKIDFDPKKIIDFRSRRRVLGIPSGPFLFNLALVTAIGYSSGKYIFEEPLKEFWKEGGVGQQKLKERQDALAAKEAAAITKQTKK